MTNYYCYPGVYRYTCIRWGGPEPAPPIRQAKMDPLNSSNSCYVEFVPAAFTAVAAVRAFVGFISFIACLLVIVLLVLFKKYRFFAQRLILYLTLAAALHALSYTLARVNYYTPRPITDPYCNFGGLFNHYTAIVELIAIWCLSLSIFANAIFRRRTNRLELLYIILPWTLPLTYIWIAVWKKGYGTEGPFCGIRFFNDDCSPFALGKWLVFGMWYIPLYTSLGLIFVMFVIVGLRIWWDARKWQGKYDPKTMQRKAMMKNEIRPIIWYPIIYMALNMFSLINQIYYAARPGHPQIALWFLRALISPIRGAFIAIVYALDKETRTQLRWIKIKAAFLDLFHTSRVREYAIPDIPYQSMDELHDSLHVHNYSPSQVN